MSNPSHKHDKLIRWAIAAGASSFAETVSFPMDLVKVRLQLQNELSTQPVEGKTFGFFGMFKKVLKNEGFFSLFKGSGAAALRQVIYGGISIGMYKTFKVFLYGEKTTISFHQRIVVSLVTGLVGQSVALPLDLIKVRMQADGRLRSMGLQPRYKNATDAFFRVIKEEGFRAYFVGVTPTLIRAALMTGGGIACYDQSREWFVKTFNLSDEHFFCRTVNSTFASMVSGIVSAMASNPFDVVKTRLVNQHKGKHLYKGTWDCFVKIAKIEGPLAFTKGFLATCMRMVPWQFIFYNTGEFLSQLLLHDTLTR